MEVFGTQPRKRGLLLTDGKTSLSGSGGAQNWTKEIGVDSNSCIAITPLESWPMRIYQREARVKGGGGINIF